MSHDEIQELLGAYALDAVEPEERVLIEDHLRSCPRCAAEVADHREVAAMLAHGGGADAPEGLWGQIVAALEDEPPAPELSWVQPVGAATSLDDRRAARHVRRGARWWPGAVAAAALVVGLLGVQVLRDADGGTGGGTAESIEDLALAALDEPGARPLALTSSDGELAAQAVITPGGSGFLLADALPDVGEARTYQLWGVRRGSVVSLGVLGRDPDVVAFHAGDGIDRLVVTAEVAGGVLQSANPPVVATA